MLVQWGNNSIVLQGNIVVWESICIGSHPVDYNLYCTLSERKIGGNVRETVPSGALTDNTIRGSLTEILSGVIVPRQITGRIELKK